MKIFDLSFIDGKSCRCIVLEESADDAEEVRQLRNNFHPGYVVDVERVIPPPPSKLPWVAQRKGLWTPGLFILSRIDAETFQLEWPGGSASGDKEEISATVRLHYLEGV